MRHEILEYVVNHGGVSPAGLEVGSERLGHATIATTMDVYSHVLPGLQEAAALAVAAKLSRK